MSLEETLDKAWDYFYFWIHYCKEFNETTDSTPDRDESSLRKFTEKYPSLFEGVYDSKGNLITDINPK